MKKIIAIILGLLMIFSLTLQAAAFTKVAVKGIKLNASNITLTVKKTFDLKATLTPANTTQKLLSYVTDNKKIASVDKTGKITGVSVGKATITVYTYNKKIFAKCKVTVTPSATLSPAKPVNLKVMWWGTDARHKATMSALELYTKLHKNITFDSQYTTYDQYWNKLSLMLASATAPDLFMDTIGWFEQLSAYNNGEGAVVKLQDNKYINLDMFDKGTIINATYKGNVLGVPVGLNTNFGVLKNLDFFTKYSIPGNFTMTWDNIIKYGKAVHEKDKDAYLIGGTGATAQVYHHIFYGSLEQLIGKVLLTEDYTINVKKEDVVTVLKFMKQLQDDYVLEPYKETYSYKEFKENLRWNSGKIGLALLPASYISQQKLPGVKYAGDVFPVFPKAKDQGSYMYANLFWSINKASLYKKETGDLLTWLMTDKDAILALGESRGPQPVDSSRQILLDAGLSDPCVGQLFTAISKQPATKLKGVIENASQVPFIQEQVDCYSKVLLGVATPEKAAEEFMSAWQAASVEAKKKLK